MAQSQYYRQFVSSICKLHSFCISNIKLYYNHIDLESADLYNSLCTAALLDNYCRPPTEKIDISTPIKI